MNTFYLKKRVFFVIILFSIILISLQWFNKESKQDPITLFSFNLFSEIQTASVNFHRAFSKTIQEYLFLLDIKDRNQILEQENKKLIIKQQLFEEAIEENKRLKNIIDFSKDQPFELLVSEVISADLLSKNQLFTINKGSFHGVKKKMGVLHPSGIVGYIFRTSPHSSQVITLFHPLASLPVRNRNSRVTGLLAPSEKNRLLFKFWEEGLFDGQIQKSFKPGDPIITIKSDQFPSGFLVGQVLPFSSAYKGIRPYIYIQPFVDFNSLEEVFIVLKPKDNLERAGKDNEKNE